MPKRGYHHGNLKQALVDAALKLIEEKGHATDLFARQAIRWIEAERAGPDAGKSPCPVPGRRSARR